jgi:outer membrane cobalamin receptor
LQFRAYGADAVAGVVNFVMNDHFEGARIDGNYAFNQHDNSDSGIPSLLNRTQSAASKSTNSLII